MLNPNIVLTTTNLVLQDLPQGYTHSYSYNFLRVLPLSGVFIEVSLKPIYPIMVREIFKFVFRLSENAYVNQKNESSYFYSSSNNSPPGSYHYPPGRGKLLISPKQRVLQNLFPPQHEKGRRNYIALQ